MTLFVAGSNVYGQWFSDRNVLNTFKDIRKQNVELCFSTWSYNIFKLNDSFYISGCWLGESNSWVKVKLPKPNLDLCHIQISGNDYNLFVIQTKTSSLWILNFDNFQDWNWQYRSINLETEMPLDENICVSKRQKTVVNNITKSIATGYGLCLLTSDGSLFEFPNKIKINHCIGTICDIDYGYEHGILLTDFGGVYTWGNGKRCQLGHGDLNSIEDPKEVEALAGIKIVKVRAGGWHSLALSENGDLYVWGWNDTGQLGLRVEPLNNSQKKRDNLKNNLGSRPLPTLVDFYQNDDEIVEVSVKDMSCGSRHTVVLLEDNTVWTTGINKYGQLGICPNKVPSLITFTKVFECNNITNVHCGPWCSILVTL